MAAKRKTRGGAQPYRKGRDHENLIVKLYRQAGCLAQRSPKSSSVCDVLAILPGGCVHIIQAKLGGYMPPAERKQLVELAEHFGADPILAFEKNPVRRRNLRTGEELSGLYTTDTD